MTGAASERISRRLNSVALIGPGAIGCSFGAHLASSGRHAFFVCARHHFDELRVETADGILRSDPPVYTDPSDVGPVDFVLVTVKAGQESGIASWMDALVTDDTVVAVLQNGVEHKQRLKPYSKAAQIVPTVVRCPSKRIAPGHAVCRERIELEVPDDASGYRIKELFDGSGVTVRLSTDFTTASWSKLCVNISHGSITALTCQPVGVFREHPDLLTLAGKLVAEAVQVARAEGASLDDNFSRRIVDRLAERPPDAQPSILQDRLAGRPLEYEAQNGAVVRIGRHHGIPTPWNQAMRSLLAAIPPGATSKGH